MRNRISLVLAIAMLAFSLVGCSSETDADAQDDMPIESEDGLKYSRTELVEVTRPDGTPIELGGDSSDEEDEAAIWEAAYPVKVMETDYGQDPDPNLKKFEPEAGVSDFYGSVNGHGFSLTGTDFAASFGSAGWNLNPDDNGVRTFISAVHDDYPDVDVYLYPVERSANGMALLDDVMDNGFIGYHVSVRGSSVVPNMTWHGFTFGASKDVITSTYGESSTSVSVGSYELLRYFMTDDVALEFYVYEDGGLQAVDFTAY